MVCGYLLAQVVGVSRPVHLQSKFFWYLFKYVKLTAC